MFACGHTVICRVMHAKLTILGSFTGCEGLYGSASASEKTDKLKHSIFDYFIYAKSPVCYEGI